MTEKELTSNISRKLLFLSIPIGGGITLLKFHNLYLMLGISLLLMVLSSISILFIYNKEGNKENSILMSSVGFILVSTFSGFADIKYLNWLFLTGIVILAVYSEISFSIMAVIAHIMITAILAVGTEEYRILSVLSAVSILVLTRYFSDFVSFIYALMTIFSFNIVLFLILDGMVVFNLFTEERVLNLGAILLAVILSWILHLNFSKKKNNAEVEKSENVEASTIVAAEENVSSPIEIVEESISRDFSLFLSEGNKLYGLMKSKNVLYERALQSAKICKDMAEIIGADSNLAEVGAFYCECGRLRSNNYIKESLKLLKYFSFPNEVLTVVKEHHYKIGKPGTKEAAIIMIENKLFSTMEFFKKENKKFSADFIVNNVTDSILMSEKLNNSGMTISEYKLIKDYLIKEASKNYDYFD